jgi:carboxypeptidase C (cathepsin A)
MGAYVNFSEFSTVVGDTYSVTGDDGRESMTIESIRELLKADITVTLFAGDADYNCNWLGGEAVAQEINHEGYSSAGYANLITTDHVKVSAQH